MNIAATILFIDFSKIRPVLLGLLYDSMRSGFQEAYGRPWQPSDGVPFTLERTSVGVELTTPGWGITLPGRCGNYDHFLIRDLDMLDALSHVTRSDITQLSSLERKLEAAHQSLELLRDSAWQMSIAKLVKNVRSRVTIKPLSQHRCPSEQG